MSADLTISAAKARPHHRAAVIGAGWIGAGEAMNYQTVGVQSHAEAYTCHARAELCAITDSDGEKAKAAAAKWNAGSWFQDVPQMLAETQPELVSICTPDALHAETLRQVLACPSVKGILAEKPLALTTQEAEKAAALAASRGVVLAVNYSRRFCPAYRALRKQLQAGLLGRIQHVTGYYGKGLIHNGTHWLNLLDYFFGPVKTIQRVPVPDADPETPTVLIGLQAGFSAILQGCDPRAFTLFEMDMVGERGRVRLVDNGQIFEYFEVVPSKHYAGYNNLGLSKVRERCLKHAMVLAVNDLIGCVEGRLATPACAPREAITALQLAEDLLGSPAMTTGFRP